MLNDSTMPCYKYLARSVSNEPEQLELARAFITNFESRGFSREDTLYHYSTLSHYTTGMENTIPIYSYHGKILPPEEYASKVMSDKSIKKRRSCQSYCKSVNKGFVSICKLCPLSVDYSCRYIEREYELLRYVAQSSENLSHFMAKADRNVFKSYVDFASDISVDKPAVVPLLKEIYHLISQRGSAFYETDGTLSERFMSIRQALVMSFCEDYPGFKEVLEINPRVLNVMWKIMVENIINAENLTDEGVTEVLANMADGTDPAESQKNDGELSIFSYFDMVMSDAARTSAADGGDVRTISDNSADALLETDSEAKLDMEDSEAISGTDGTPSNLPENEQEILEASAGTDTGTALAEQSAASMSQDGLYIPPDDPDECRFPFKEDVAEDESESDQQDKPQKVKKSGRDDSTGEIMESSLVTKMPDNADTSGDDSAISSAESDVVDDASMPEPEEAAASKQPQNAVAGGGNAKKTEPSEDTDFSPKDKLDISVKLDRSPLMHTVCLNVKALKTLFYPYISYEKDAVVSILKRRCLPLEVIFTEDGIPYYLMWVSGISKYLIVEAYHVPQSLATIFRHNSVVKILYQPYYLYSLMRLTGIRPKNIYSIFSMDTLLHPLAMPSDFNKLMVLYLKDCAYLVNVKSGLEWLDGVLVGLQGYDFIYSVQTRQISRSSLDEYSRTMLRDEVLGTSFMRSVFLNDDSYLFDYDAEGTITYNNDFTLSVKKTGFLVSYSIDSDELEPVQIRKLFMDALIELAYKGKIRKFDLFLLAMSDNLMIVYIAIRCYEILTTLLQNYFNRYALQHRIERFHLVSDHRRLDPEGVDFVPIRIELPEKISDVLDTLVTPNAKITVPESRVRGPQKALISKPKRKGKPFSEN